METRGSCAWARAVRCGAVRCCASAAGNNNNNGDGDRRPRKDRAALRRDRMRVCGVGVWRVWEGVGKTGGGEGEVRGRVGAATTEGGGGQLREDRAGAGRRGMETGSAGTDCGGGGGGVVRKIVMG